MGSKSLPTDNEYWYHPLAIGAEYIPPLCMDSRHNRISPSKQKQAYLLPLIRKVHNTKSPKCHWDFAKYISIYLSILNKFPLSPASLDPCRSKRPSSSSSIAVAVGAVFVAAELVESFKAWMSISGAAEPKGSSTSAAALDIGHRMLQVLPNAWFVTEQRVMKVSIYIYIYLYIYISMYLSISIYIYIMYRIDMSWYVEGVRSVSKRLIEEICGASFCVKISQMPGIACLFL